jgi:hypothetical protein
MNAGVSVLTPEEAARLPGPPVNLPSGPAAPDLVEQPVDPNAPLPMPPSNGRVIEITPRQPSTYEDYRGERNASETVQRGRERQSRRRPAAPAAAEPEPTPEERQAARDGWVEARVAELAPPASAPLPDDPQGATPPEQRGPREPRRTPEAQSAARTVARNLAEGVTGIPRGAMAAFASLFEAGDDLADWLAGTTPATAPNTPGRVIGRTIRSLQPGREPTTMTGQVSEEIAQFVTGFLRGGVTLRRFGLLQGGGRARQAARGAAAGAIADFFYQEADEANLAAVWQRAGLPENALTGFLATRPDDDAAANRLRNAAAGVITGAALDGLIAVARATRGAMAARREAVEAGAPPPPRPEPATLAEASGVPARPERDLLIVGDPARPLVEVRPAGDSGRRMAEAAAATSDAGTGVSAATAATALTRAAEEARTRVARFIAPEWLPRANDALTEADVAAREAAEAEAARLPEGVAQLVHAMRRGAVGPRGELSLVSFVVRNGGVRSTGEGRNLWEMLGGNAEAARARPGLFSNIRRPSQGFVSSQNVETMAQMVRDAGYLPEGSTLDDFYRAIDDEIAGRARLYGTTEDAAGRAMEAAADDLARVLDEAGVSLADGDAAIARALGLAGDAAPRTEADLAREAAAEGAAARTGGVVETQRTIPGRPVETVENTSAIRAANDVGDVYVNWGRIETGEDVRAVMRDMADAYRPRINEAGRGVQTNEATRALADQMNLTVEELLARRPGEVLNAETALAARDLYTASGQRLVEAARMAAAPGAGALEAAAFRRMMSVHYAIQAEVLGARREAGRAVQAWAIPSRAGGQQMRMIEDLLEQSGGIETAQAMARRLAVLADNLPPDEAARAMSAFVNRGVFGRSLEAVQQVWINALLSSPATHLANITGNALNIPLTLGERLAQAGVGRALGTEDAALLGEAPAMLYGLMTGFRDSLRLAARSYADDGAEVAALIGRQDLPRQGAISSAAWGADAGSGLGRALDFVGHEVVSAPGRAMGAEDAFFKSAIYRMELHAQAYRQAVREVGQAADGSVDAAAIGARMAEIMRDPPEAVARAAADEALYRTFNRAAGPIAQALLRVRSTDSPGWNLAASTVLPFIRTPANLFSYGLERTPLAPMVGQWRAEVAAGGARRDAALARVALGSLILAHTFQVAEQGFVTGYGPTDPREREAWQRSGAQPYSVRIGDTWIPFNRLDPYGFILGFAADVAGLMARRDLGEREEVEASRMIAATVAMASNALGERSFFRGVSALAEAMDNRQPSAERWVGQTISGLLVPGIVGAVGQALDPAQYDRGQGWIAGRLAGLASDPGIPRRNLWGEPMQRPGVATLGPVGAAISPIRPTSAGGRPVDREMLRLGMGLQAVDQNGSVTFGDAVVNLRNVNPAALDRLRVLAGNELGLPAYGGKGLADALDEMVQGQGQYGRHFLASSDEGRERAIRQVATAYRAAARRALLADPAFADVAELVARRTGENREGRGEVPVPTSPAAVMRAPGEPPPRRSSTRETAPALR